MNSAIEIREIAPDRWNAAQLATQLINDGPATSSSGTRPV